MAFLSHPHARLVLNIIRLLNIISLVGIIAANVAFLIATVRIEVQVLIVLQIFDCAQRILVILLVLFLILTELPNMLGSHEYILSQWAALSCRSGFLALCFAFLLLGCNTIADLDQRLSTPAHMGPTTYKMVLAAGSLAIGMAGVNFIAHVLFTDRQTPLTARQRRNPLEAPAESDVDS